jgi:hypothetical protein
MGTSNTVNTIIIKIQEFKFLYGLALIQSEISNDEINLVSNFKIGSVVKMLLNLSFPKEKNIELIASKYYVVKYKLTP